MPGNKKQENRTYRNINGLKYEINYAKTLPAVGRGAPWVRDSKGGFWKRLAKLSPSVTANARMFAFEITNNDGSVKNIKKMMSKDAAIAYAGNLRKTADANKVKHIKLLHDPGPGELAHIGTFVPTHPELQKRIDAFLQGSNQYERQRKEWLKKKLDYVQSHLQDVGAALQSGEDVGRPRESLIKEHNWLSSLEKDLTHNVDRDIKNDYGEIKPVSAMRGTRQENVATLLKDLGGKITEVSKSLKMIQIGLLAVPGLKQDKAAEVGRIYADFRMGKGSRSEWEKTVLQQIKAGNVSIPGEQAALPFGIDQHTFLKNLPWEKFDDMGPTVGSAEARNKRCAYGLSLLKTGTCLEGYTKSGLDKWVGSMNTYSNGDMVRIFGRGIRQVAHQAIKGEAIGRISPPKKLMRATSSQPKSIDVFKLSQVIDHELSALPLPSKVTTAEVASAAGAQVYKLLNKFVRNIERERRFDKDVFDYTTKLRDLAQVYYDLEKNMGAMNKRKEKKALAKTLVVGDKVLVEDEESHEQYTFTITHKYKPGKLIKGTVIYQRKKIAGTFEPRNIVKIISPKVKVSEVIPEVVKVESKEVESLKPANFDFLKELTNTKLSKRLDIVRAQIPKVALTKDTAGLRMLQKQEMAIQDERMRRLDKEESKQKVKAPPLKAVSMIPKKVRSK